jgi:phage shock protein PspC (stress-responsive transcriptional regulator)
MMADRRLVRSTSDRMIAGVCGGLAEYLGIDPVFVRLAFVIGELATAGAGGLIVYIVLWAVMPEGMPEARHAA